MMSSSLLMEVGREFFRRNDCFFSFALRVVWAMLRGAWNALVAIYCILSVIGAFFLQIAVDVISALPQVLKTVTVVLSSVLHFLHLVFSFAGAFFSSVKTVGVES